MTTQDLGQQTNELIQKEHSLFRYFTSIQRAYERDLQDAKNNFESRRENAERIWNKVQSDSDAELGQIQQLLDSARGAVGSSPWSEKVDLINFQPSALITAPASDDINQQISRCRAAAFQTHQDIMNFLRSHTSTSTSGIAWLSTGLGCLTFFVCGGVMGSVLAAQGGSGVGFFLGFIIALFVGIALYASQSYSPVNKLRAMCSSLTTNVSTAESAFMQRLKEPEAVYQRQLAEAQSQYRADTQKAERTLAQKVQELVPVFRSFNENAQQTNFLTTEWSDDTSWKRWHPFKNAALSPVARLGMLSVVTQPTLPPLPALVGCPGNQNILFTAYGEGKEYAYAAIRSLMLRILATQPAGKVHFTLIDPVGLGKNVEIFMQLADEEYDKRLVNSRAWTEQRQIEARLADISEEIVTIGQKYLRGQYKTIEEYNKQAGEVEEPYRVLVVLGFPINFTDETAKNLIRIAENGPKCGVSTLIMMDSEAPAPYSFNLDDLKRVSTVLTWNGHSFDWQDPDFVPYQLNVDSPPTVQRFNDILQAIGTASKDASEVKVPFERISPPPEKWWRNEEWWRGTAVLNNGHTRDGISVPLGRAGATKLQLLEMGKQNSTAHHALVAGKTGSGKTTLLHVLITNLALTYSPNEIELYLVDFKTVGFTPYTNFNLPHIRVVAIQSEREFGLSVLRKLDAELVRRKEIFRRANVQDINQYRKAQPRDHMPRILLLVDEFQEFFIEEDEIKRNAEIYLERLVRQGRGLGIHILLGSQSLSGTSQLPTATLGQMDIRIAMRCEERDARLILSEDNPAARLLSRPGEAIYNATNGLEEGNNKFQCAWLSDEELKSRLAQLERFAQQPQLRILAPAEETLVFDGNAYADVTKNKQLKHVIDTPQWPASPKMVTAWLGEPVEIKDPTNVQFRSQAGNNFLIVGQQDEIALGMMITALYSLAAQYAPGKAEFYIVDLSPVDVSYAGFFEKAAMLLPHKMQIINRRGLLSAITRLSDSVQDRIEPDASPQPPVYLFIYGLQRARDLRPSEEFGYSFGSGDSDRPSPSKQFATILREGPDVGVHTLAWSDTLTNLNRTLERGLLREFEMRAVFQMSVDDSNNLIDTATASKLGTHRALLYSEETGRAEKFRPYGLPSIDWLHKVAKQINQKR